jgi:hypothetical protein
MEEKIKSIIKTILSNSKVQTFLWTTVNSSIVLVLALTQDGTIKIENPVLIAGIIAGLNTLTKYINKKYLLGNTQGI